MRLVQPTLRRNVPRRAGLRQTAGYTITNVPVGQATTVRQPLSNKVHVERAREQVGIFAISPTTPVGTSQQYLLNPLTLSGTRLQRLAQNYQKFRFRKVSMTVQSSASTSVGGLYVVGYNSNPDAELNGGFASVQQVAALPGATSANAWRTVTVAGRLEDRGAWYTLDPDSDEIMKTTQGYFAIVAQIPSTGTGATQYAVWLDYEIEFTGASVNTVPEVIGLWPSGNWVRDTNINYANFTSDSGEPSPPATFNAKIYTLNPAWIITDQAGVDVNCLAFKVLAGGYGFYTSVENASSDSRIALPNQFRTPRTIISIVP